jgi:diguanylate cyclase
MHYAAMMGMELMPAPGAVAVMSPVVSPDALMIAIVVLAFVNSAMFLLYLIPEKDRAQVEEKHLGVASPMPRRAVLVPVESEGATNLIPVGEICAIQATTHYTLVYDGRREYFSPWSITEAEERLDKNEFMRVHCSHLIAIDKVSALRRAGESAVVEFGGPAPRCVPVSRDHHAELKSRLGLHLKVRGHAAAQV